MAVIRLGTAVPIKTQVFCIHAVVWGKVMIREQQMIPYLNRVAV